MSSHSLTTATPTRRTSTSASTPVNIALLSQNRVTATSVMLTAMIASSAPAPRARKATRRRRACMATSVAAGADGHPVLRGGDVNPDVVLGLVAFARFCRAPRVVDRMTREAVLVADLPIGMLGFSCTDDRP